MPGGRPLKASIGDRFGKLVVTGIRPGKRRLPCVLICRCDCGNTAEVASCTIRKRVSCGCEHWPTKPHKALMASALVALYGHTKGNAKRRGIAFELTKEQFTTLVESNCYYCGAPPTAVFNTAQTRKRSLPGLPKNGIDRADPAIGYLPANCRPCCGTCNFAKQQLTATQFVEHCQKIVAWSTTAPRSVFD